MIGVLLKSGAPAHLGNCQQFDPWKEPNMKSGIRALLLIGITLATATGCQLGGRRHGHNGCNNCNSELGCRPCKVGWQRGGTDYGNHLGGNHFGRHGDYVNNNQVGSGVPGPAVGYPYYTTRGPRDFFANNPPSIGR